MPPCRVKWRWPGSILVFEQKSVLHNAPCCRLVFRNAGLDNSVPVSKEAKKGWDYHCGHYYKTFSEYVRTVFSDGEIILKRVDEKFADRFGEKNAWIYCRNI